MIARFKTPTFVLLGALVAALALPGGALAEYYVPPGNSAANQYTETLPSAGGDSGGKRKDKVTAAATLGAGNAKKLEQQGAAGKAAAQLAAETAPAELPTATVPATPDGGGNQASKGERPGGGSGNPSGGEGGSGDGGNGAAAATTQVDQPSGSSALGEVVAQATGSADDGSLGLWLPIAIVAALVGSIAWARSRHGRTV